MQAAVTATSARWRVGCRGLLAAGWWNARQEARRGPRLL